MLSALAFVLLAPQSPAAIAEAKIADRMKQTGTVGLAAQVIVDGKTVFSKGFGFADFEAQRPATAKTVFRLGSISKPVAAVMAMQLVEQGKLDLEVDARRYAPEFPAKEWPFTLRHVLSHTSGIRHYLPVTDRTSNVFEHFANAAEAFELFGASRLQFEPGTKYSYSTHAYTVAARAIETATGTPFPRAAERMITRRVGPSLRCEEISLRDPERTELYRVTPTTRFRYPKREDNSWKYAGGGFESNVADLARFGWLMIDGKLVREASRKAMWTRMTLKDGKATNYGLGFVVGNDGTISHSGSQQGCQTMMVLHPEKRVVVVVMSNSNGPAISGPAAQELLTLFSPKP